MRPLKTFRSKKEYVYETLRTAILEGDLEPGARLVIDDLAAELGVSPIPIREALQQLQGDGFVTIAPYVGASVTAIDAGLVCEVFDLLEALEVISGRAACRYAQDQDLDKMAALLDSMDAHADDPDRFSEENARLHQLLCEWAGTALTQTLVRRVLAHWDRLRRHYLGDVFAHRIGAAQREHRDLLQALRSRDPDRVERLIRQHNRAARAAYEAHLEKTGQAAERCTQPGETE